MFCVQQPKRGNPSMKNWNWSDNMYKYTICNDADEEVFCRQCRALKKHIPDLQVGEFLDCLDDTYIQFYQHPKGSIEVRCDADIDVVYVDSEFDLLPYFQEGTPWDRETDKFRDHEMVRIKETGATGKIKDIYHYVDGEVRYDVEGHIWEYDKAPFYRAEELEKIY